MNLKQQADTVVIKDSDEEGVYRCHISKAFSNNPINVRSHICHEHPKFVFMCSDSTCVEAYITHSGLNKHKQKHLDQGEEDFPICYFVNNDSKQKNYDEHMCLGKLEATKNSEAEKNRMDP